MRTPRQRMTNVCPVRRSEVERKASLRPSDRCRYVYEAGTSLKSPQTITGWGDLSISPRMICTCSAR